MTPELGWIGLVAAIVKRTPRLDGALCRGKSELFDAVEGARAKRAAALCRACPAKGDCEAWVQRQRTGQLVGVVAGRRFMGHRDTGPDDPIAHGDKVKQ